MLACCLKTKMPDTTKWEPYQPRINREPPKWLQLLNIMYIDDHIQKTHFLF